MDDLEKMYSQLTQEQCTTIAQQYMQQFSETGNVASQQKFAHLNVSTVTAHDLADMHKHADTTHPGMLQQVRKHPFVTAALGALAIYEVDKHFGK